MLEALVGSARRAHREALAGKLSELGPVLRVLEEDSHPVARAWALALRTELWLAEPRYGFRVPAAWLGDFVEGPPLARSGALIALANAARSALLDFDAASLGALEPLAAELSSGLPEQEVLCAELVCAFAALGRGAADRAAELGSEIVRRAAKAEQSALVVEAQAVRALAATLDGKLDALELARRASLMARTEGLPQPEFLAHFALARARRHARQPHLSLRILEAMSDVVPPAWRAWLGWELVLARGRDVDRKTIETAPSSNAKTLTAAAHALIDAARAGDRDGFARANASLEQSAQGFAPVRLEAAELAAALDPALSAPSQELAAWRFDDSVLLPASIDGLRVREPEGDETSAAYVWVQPGEKGRRLLHAALPLVTQPAVGRIRQSQRAQGRVETLLAILALAGPDGRDEADCFARAYGFELVPEVHRGVFDVLLHRARTTLGELGQLARREGRLVLEPARPLIVPDPRVSQRTTDRVLVLLAERGSASAKDAAVTLGISLRSAQAALAELSGSGACEPRKDGRNVAYVVEDTVFSEPSRRLSTSDLTGLTSLSSRALGGA